MKISVAILSILIILYCSLYERNYLSFAKEIVYTDSLELSYEDFQGYTVPYYELDTDIESGSRIGAYMSADTEIVVKKETGDSLDYFIYSVFKPQSSAIVIKEGEPDSALLKHELYHFKTTELYARYLKKMIIDSEKAPSDKLIGEVIKELENAHKRYDSITVHGSRRKIQLWYQDEIDKKLDQYSNFTEHSIKELYKLKNEK